MAKDDTWHGFNFNVCHGRTLGFSKLPDLILCKADIIKITRADLSNQRLYFIIGQFK